MKRYLITGASRGIGRAIAEKLAAPDHTLLLHGRDRASLEKTCRLVESRGGNALLLCYDLRYIDAIERMLEEIGPEPIRALISNAAIAYVKPLEEITLEEWQSTLAVNVTAPFFLTQKLAPKMAAGSTIVNILSVAAKTGFPSWSCYCMSKFALEGFSQAVRTELRPRKIRVLNIYPAATSTEIWDPIKGEWPRELMLPADAVGDAVAYALSQPPDVALENITLQHASGPIAA